MIMMGKGYKLSCRRISRLMSEMDLVCQSKRKKYKYNFVGSRDYRKNIINREFDQEKPNAA
jgi:hypothetical protein